MRYIILLIHSLQKGLDEASANMSTEQFKNPDKLSVIPRKRRVFSPVNDMLRREVDSIISTLADKRSIEALIALLDDDEFDVRWIAAESLIRIGRKSIIPLLVSLKEGKEISYPSKVQHVLQSLLTRSEKKALKPLLVTLSATPGPKGRIDLEASSALKRIFSYVN